MEDHHDDCGEDLSSLTCPALIDGDTSDNDSDYTSAAESDVAHEDDLRTSIGGRAFPIDVSKVAPATPGTPLKGRDPRAPKKAKESVCDGCRNFRPRNDWEHSRKIGECSYPYDEPFIPQCEACVARLPNHSSQHTFEAGECRWGEATATGVRPRQQVPHEPLPRHHAEPTAHQPATIGGQELGAEAEAAVQEADRLEAFRSAKTRGEG